ncbi:MAG: type II secretion system protein [Gammaproteobacteria bacterium]|nr:type II secretion system protein [Gammaproteobacteria bacterium]
MPAGNSDFVTVYPTLRPNIRGFSLLEMSIALTILAILSYTLLTGVQTSRDYRHYTENEVSLEFIKKSLLTFVQSNGFLPCPDSDASPDGVENRTLGVCSRKSGFLPYKMLGLKSSDAWGNPFLYAVNEQAIIGTAIVDSGASAVYFNNGVSPLNGTTNPCSSTGAPCFNAKTKPFGTTDGVGNLTICGENIETSCNVSTPETENIEAQAIAVVLSLGVNGASAWSQYPLSEGDYSLAEDENLDDDLYYWKAKGSNVERAFFDDQLIWLTGYDVKYALLRSELGLREQ